MKKIIFWTFLLSSITILFSQTKSALQTFESREYPNKIKDDSIQSVHTFKNGNIGILRIRKKEVLIDIFNDILEKKESISIEKNKKETYVGDFLNGDDLFIFTELYPKRNLRTINCYKFNIVSKNKEKKEISKSKIDLKLTLFSNKKETSLSASPNSNYFSIISYIIHAGEIYFDINVFDSNNFKLLYNKNFKRPEHQKYSISEILMDEEKRVFILGRSFYNKSSPELISLKKSHYIIDKTSSLAYENLKIETSEKHVKSLKPFFLNGDYNIYGFYSEKKFGKIKGVCTFSINKKSLKMNNHFFDVLPPKIYDDLLGQRKREKNKELKNFYLNYILKDNENSVYLLAEEFYTTNNTYATGAGTVTTSQQHYDDIIILKINKNQQIEWGKAILKKDNKTSYNAFIDKENTLHILLNSGKNLTSKKDGRLIVTQGLFESSSLYDISFNSNDGNTNYYKIQNNRNKTYYLPNHGKYENNKFVIPSKSKGKSKLMLLK